MMQLKQQTAPISAYDLAQKINLMNFKEYPTLGELLAPLGLNNRGSYMFIGKTSEGQRGFPLEDGSSLRRITSVQVVSHHIGG